MEKWFSRWIGNGPKSAFGSRYYFIVGSHFRYCNKHPSKKPNKLPDAVIAASAIFLNATLVTQNIKDFEGIEGLFLLNPFDMSAQFESE